MYPVLEAWLTGADVSRAFWINIVPCAVLIWIFYKVDACGTKELRREIQAENERKERVANGEDMPLIGEGRFKIRTTYLGPGDVWYDIIDTEHDDQICARRPYLRGAQEKMKEFNMLGNEPIQYLEVDDD